MIKTLSKREAQLQMELCVSTGNQAENINSVPDDKVYAMLVKIAHQELCLLSEELEEYDHGTGWKGNKIWFDDWTITEESNGLLTAIECGFSWKSVHNPLSMEDARKIAIDMAAGRHGCNPLFYRRDPQKSLFSRIFAPNTHGHGPCEHGTVHE